MNKINLFSSPSHIAENGMKEPVEEVSLDFIVSKQILQTLLNNICADINYPMTIIQWDTNDKRIDSTLSSICLRPSCENFRRTAGTMYCENTDSNYASIFKGLKKKSMNQMVGERIENEEFMKNILCERGKAPEYIVRGDTGYLKYRCKMMGYVELIFPILFEEDVIGTLFVGQIKIKNNNSFYKVQDEFFKYNPDIFDEYIKKAKLIDNSDYIKDDIKRKIMDNQSKIRNMLPNYLELSDSLIGIDPVDEYDETQFEDLIDDILSRLLILQKQLNNLMQDKRELFIRNTIELSMNKFYNLRCEDTAISDDSIPPDKVIRNFWNDVARSMEIVVQKLGLEYMAIFGVDTLSISEKKFLNVVSFIPAHRSKNVNWSNEYSTYRINLDNIDPKLFYQVTTSRKNPCLLRAVDGLNNKEPKNKLLIFFPVSDKPHYSVVMLISFWNNSDNIYDNILDSLTKHLINGGTAIFSYLISRLSRLSEASTNRMLRIYRHEISHVSLGLRHILDFRLRDSSYIHQLSDDKINEIRMDFGSSLSQLNALSANVESVMGTPRRTDYEEVKVFKELIYKWRELYKRQIEHKRLSILTPSVNDKDELRPPYKTDRLLLDQIIYNLIDNAIKYCYWGTNIHIDCVRPNNKSTKRKLIITSFGIEMDNNDSPYKLFFRGFDEDDNEASGVGIGLYIVKELANRLDGEVVHKCIKISSYNIPLLEAYINLPYQIINKGTLVNVKREINRIKESKYTQNYLFAIEELRNFNSIYADVVSVESKINYTKLPTKRVLEQINMATYKTTFEVNI